MVGVHLWTEAHMSICDECMMAAAIAEHFVTGRAADARTNATVSSAQP